MGWTRRRLLANTAALSSFPLWRLEAATANLPTPDFSVDVEAAPFLAGLRPYRAKTYRLDWEHLGEKLVVHDYGHGGAGITMSWGCAHEVRDIVSAHGNPRQSAPAVAVLGAGVMGLTAASLLIEMGCEVVLYAAAFTPETTSDIAGGQWAPSTVAFGDDPQSKRRFHRLLRRSFATHLSNLDRGFGVSRRTNYFWKPSKSFSVVPRDVVGAPRPHSRLPFEGHTQPGLSYETLLIEPPIFLTRLMNDLDRAGVAMHQQSFECAADIEQLDEPVVVNCTGLGARDLFNDQQVVPIKGQLVRLPPQPELDYLYCGHGYIFPREDGVIVGGTFESEFKTEEPVEKECLAILAHARSAFYGDADPEVRPPAAILRSDRHM